MPYHEELEGRLEEAGLEAPLCATLARFGGLVLEANHRFNLTGAKTAAEFAPHLLDSLTVVPFLREPYVDVGSGAGLPAIPVAIATGMPVILIEATAKKARFLETLLETLGLRGRVVAVRAELAGHSEDLREGFASGTARAIGSAPAVVELLLPLIAVGGAAVLQRGLRDEPERAALEDAALMLGGGIEAEHPLPDGRVIILLRKRSHTPPPFPRRPGIPTKRPLCR
jgi:16S rRNA (guanine527-N7)-methyltransferase